MDPVTPKVPDGLAKRGIKRAEHGLPEGGEVPGLPRLVVSFFGKELMDRLTEDGMIEWRKKEGGGGR